MVRVNNDAEVDILAESGPVSRIVPATALKVAYGVTQVGKFPEMVQKGVNVSLERMVTMRRIILTYARILFGRGHF